MRPPWLPGLAPADDVDSLQADVMRFVAIFGLCLAAIFSLVRELEDEPAATAAVERVAVERPASTRLPAARAAPDEPRAARGETAATAQVPPAVANDATSRVEVATEAAQEGFSLQFESPAAMRALMRNNAIRVYARQGDDFWLLDATGAMAPAAPPDSYYGMHSATLPAEFLATARRVMQRADVEWAVTLPHHTIRQLAGLMQSGGAGALLIGADAGVRRDEAPVQAP
ncbi:MAG: hypothetical protein CME59_13640 [Halioglobus sp.]|nr:hypothetical protein [Halioglobus sp.]|tara:strand:+ start:1239 stop:1925 length:687 start_codon:yes stop_codon:yes gene_type:complete